MTVGVSATILGGGLALNENSYEQESVANGTPGSDDRLRQFDTKTGNWIR